MRGLFAWPRCILGLLSEPATRLLEGGLRVLERGRTSGHPGDPLAYEEFFRRLPIGLYRSTVDGRFLYVNATLVRMLGYDSQEELMGIPVWSLYWDREDRDRWMALLERHGVLKDFEVRLRRADGNSMWVRENCRTVRGPDGKVLFLEGTLEDITERKHAEEALAESEERYRALIEHQGEGLAIVGADERFVFCNRVTGEIFGVPAGELEGRSLTEFVDTEDYRRLREETEKRRAGLRSTYRITIRRRDGELRRVQVTATPWYDRRGAFVGAFGILRDVTEEEAALEALRSSEEKYRAVVDQSADAIFLVDRAEATFLEANPATERLLALPEEELVGRPVTDFLVASSEQVARALDGLGVRDSAMLGEWEFRRSDGSVRAAEVSASVVRYADREVICVVARDVTDRKASERALQESREQVRRMQMMDLVGQLAGGVAHDFNNIVAGILGYCERVLDGDGRLDPTVRRSVAAIQELAERAAGLTQQLLAFSRRQRLSSRDFDLADVVADMETLLRHLVGEDVELAFEVPGERLHVHGDPGQVEQVLLNLVLNARDVLSCGGRIAVSVDSTLVDRPRMTRFGPVEPGRYACLSVCDDGPGIPENLLDKIFEPFFTTKERGRGSGLGLATVYGIVRQHGGWLEVDSQVGAGTTFRVYFPAIDSAGMGDRGESLGEKVFRADVPLVSGSPHSKGWVLVVCPEDSDRTRLAQWLREAGFSVVETGSVEDGESVFGLLEAGIDAVFLDRRTAGWEEFAERLRREDGGLRFLVGGPGGASPGVGWAEVPWPYRKHETWDVVGRVMGCASSRDAPVPEGTPGAGRLRV